jgi:NitT/TauT family transport system substrate-binding protein
MKWCVLPVLLLLAGLVPAAAAEAPVINLGVINLVSTAPVYIAAEKGYFREAGLDVRIEPIESTGSSMPLLASNRMQVLVGGVTAAFFNALQSNLPVILAFDSASSPVFSDILLRTDLVGTIKTPADLKGRTIGANAPGAIPVYQLASLLRTAHLTLDDVTVKYMAMPQMTVALANHALDAALMSPPLNALAVQQKVGVHWIDFDDVVRPLPTVLAAYTTNTDWIAERGEEARKFFIAIGRGARDYCQAYHHGANRGEVEDIMMKYKVSRDRVLLDETPWPARDPNGRLNVASLLDIQDVFLSVGVVKQKFPASRLVDGRYADIVAKANGTFTVENKDSTAKGCR